MVKIGKVWTQSMTIPAAVIIMVCLVFTMQIKARATDDKSEVYTSMTK